MPHDCIGRRSRFKRSPTGKRIFLTDRDVEIFRWLYRYRYLRATQLVALLQPKSEKRLIERLGNLYHETDLIDRPKVQWQRFDARYAPIVYELTLKGTRYLETCGPLPDRATTFARKNQAGITPQFEHATMIVDALVETEIATCSAANERFVPVDEILARMPAVSRQGPRPLSISVTIGPNAHMPALKAPMKTTIVPDALYGIEYETDSGKLYRFWALECENRSPRWRSTARLSSLALKQVAYNALIQSREFTAVWGIPNLALKVVKKPR